MEDSIHFLHQPHEQLLSELTERVSSFYEFLNSSGQMNRLRDLYKMYHGFDRHTDRHLSSEIHLTGSQGEVTLMKINHIRNLVQHMLALSTADRPAFDPVAANDTHEAYEAVGLAKDILQYYYHDIETVMSKVAEYAWVTSEGFLLVEWDATAYDTPPGPGQQPNGDFSFQAFPSFDVIRDPMKSADENNWWIVRKKVNMYDLIAQFGEHEDAIREAADTSRNFLTNAYPQNFLSADEPDDVFVYTLYHKHTKAVPDGRMLIFTETAILQDLPLPYRRLTLLRESPGDFMGTSLGYTPCFDLLSPQEAFDSLFSTALTNLTAFGVQVFRASRGSSVDWDQLAEGLGVILYNEGSTPPEPINLVKVPRELFEFMDRLKLELETLSGANSTVRGQPSDNVKTGSAMALMVANATQFASIFNKQHTKLLETLGMLILEILQDYAENERIVSIVGPNNLPKVRKFTGGDLGNIRKVFVNIGSPLSKTTAGKLEIAKDIINIPGATPEKYMEVLQTGRLNPVVSNQHNTNMLIKQENDKILKGENPTVVLTDMHPQHIRDHMEPLSSPEARENPEIVKAGLDHIQWHMEVWANADPNLLLALGIQPLTPPAPEEQAPMPQQGEGGQPAALQAGEEGSAQPEGRPPGQMPNMPNMPNMPTPPEAG